MTKSQHTPGPWPCEYTGDGKRILVGKGLVEGPNGYEVAEVYSDDCPREVAEANARLIAAAPELLEALETLLPYAPWVPKAGIPMTPELEEKPDVQAVLKARAAIAKARGQS